MRLLSILISALIVNSEPYEVITLNSSNHIKLIGSINKFNIDNSIKNLGYLTQKNYYIYIESPGGIVDEGERFVSQLRYRQAKGDNITCIAEYAYSMAFYIFQNCNQRYITPSGRVMQHQVSLNNNYIPLDNLDSYIKMVRKISNNINQFCAKRIGISLEEFNKKVNNDWWLYGQDVINNNVADKIVLVGFNNDLITLSV